MIVLQDKSASAGMGAEMCAEMCAEMGAEMGAKCVLPKVQRKWKLGRTAPKSAVQHPANKTVAANGV
jgi:hypothetical protein